MYKSLSFLLFALLTVCAEPQTGFSRHFQLVESAPYQYSGWRPSGPEFPVPHAVYGPPPQEYLPPGESTTTVEPEVTTTEQPTTTEEFTEAEDVNSVDNEEEYQKLTQESDDEERGVYYVYHPSGLLQRVVYVTKDDTQNMAYSARLKYENVYPISAPVYTYDSKILELQRIN